MRLHGYLNRHTTRCRRECRQTGRQAQGTAPWDAAAAEGRSIIGRLRVMREHMATILATPHAIQRIRSELRGRRLAGTNGGWPSTVDNLAEVANCSLSHLDNLREIFGAPR